MKENISHILKDLRKERGLSQVDLASKVGVQNAYISQIESGKRVPTFETFEDICKALEIPPYAVMLKMMASDEAFLSIVMSKNGGEILDKKSLKVFEDLVDKYQIEN